MQRRAGAAKAQNKSATIGEHWTGVRRKPFEDEDKGPSKFAVRRKPFEDGHKGPSKFAGKRVEHRTQDAIRWRVPTGLQWVEWHKEALDDTWRQRLTLL
jgi:hypothetical protein